MVICALLVASVSTPVVAGRGPLTTADEQTLLASLRLSPEKLLRIVGLREIGDGSSAMAEIYGQALETPADNCVLLHIRLYGDVVGDEIRWHAEETAELSERVMFREQRQGKPCTEMLEGNPVVVATPIEEQTLMRLNEAAELLALDADRLLRPIHRLSSTDAISGRLTRVGVSRLTESGSYTLQWMVGECSGYSMDVKTDATGVFFVASASRVVC